MWRWIFVFAVAGLLPLGAAAQTQQPSANARVSPSVVEVGGRVQYVAEASVRGGGRITVEEAPQFERGLKILGKTRSPQLITINGVTQRRLSLRYSLRATRLGEAKILPPVFQAGNTTVRPDAITLKVVEPGDAPKRQVEKSGQYFIDTSIEPREPYVGQQITLQYELYVDGTQFDVSPTHSHEPSLDDFWIESLTDRTARQQQMVSVRGKLMKRTPLWSYALFPLESGPVTIEDAEIELVVGAFFRRGKPVTVTADAIELDVKPLPPDAPTGFYEGNVGNYTFEVKPDQNKTRVGRAVMVDVVATGEGQIGRVRLPDLPELDGVRLTDVDEETKQNIRGLTVGGQKIATYTLTPLTEGTIRIPALEFSYFDPEAEKYVTTRSDPHEVTVAAGQLPPPPVESNALTARDVEADVDLVQEVLNRLRPPTSDPRVEPVGDPGRFPWWNWALLFASALVFGWVAFGRRVRAVFRRSPRRQRRAATESAVDQLDRAGDDPAEIARAITDGLHVAYGIPRGAVTSKDIARAFAERGLDPDVATELADVLARCEEARFSPDAAVATDDATARARAALLRLRDSGASRAGATSVGIVLAALCVAVSGIASAATSVETALEAQEQERWEAARDAWRAATAKHPDSPDVWYNLGTCATLAGDYGTARHALERAAYLAPWDEDVENNRDVIERIVRLLSIERSRTGRTLDGDETLFWWEVSTHVDPYLATGACAAFWLLAAFAIRVRRRTESAAVRDAAFVGLVLALLLAIASTAALVGRNHLLRDTNAVVVITDDIELREGPNPAAKLKRKPPAMVPGTLLRATDVRDEWMKVVWADGAGWTRSDAVRTVR